MLSVACRELTSTGMVSWRDGAHLSSVMLSTARVPVPQGFRCQSATPAGTCAVQQQAAPASSRQLLLVHRLSCMSDLSRLHACQGTHVLLYAWDTEACDLFHCDNNRPCILKGDVRVANFQRGRGAICMVDASAGTEPDGS